MKLQVNDSGAWKTVITFPLANTDYVKAAAENLGLCSQLAAKPVAFRVIDGQERAVLHWAHPVGWRVPPSAVGYVWRP